MVESVSLSTEDTVRRSKVALTPTLCQRTKPAASKVVLWDAKVLGLCLVITPAGNRSWWFVPRRDGKQIWVKLGEYQEVRDPKNPGSSWTVEAARGEAAMLRKQHDLGEDVRALVKEMRDPRTFAELVKAWEGSIRYQRFAVKTKQTYASALKNHILPVIADRLVRSIRFRDVEGLYQAIATKREPPMEKQAGGCLKLVGQILDYGEDLGWREEGAANPCRKVKGMPKGVRGRVAKAEELGRIGEALEDGVKRSIIFLVAVSGLRISEACALRWEGVDLERKILTVGEHKTMRKTGAKAVPINPAMEEILVAQQGHVGPWVFRGFKGSHFQAVTVQIWWAKLMRTLGIEGLIIHDLRRTYMTVGAELGFPPADMGVLGGHKIPGMQHAYVHLSPGGILAQASAATGAWMLEALNGKSPQIGIRPGGLAVG